MGGCLLRLMVFQKDLVVLYGSQFLGESLLVCKDISESSPVLGGSLGDAVSSATIGLGSGRSVSVALLGNAGGRGTT